MSDSQQPDGEPRKTVSISRGRFVRLLYRQLRNRWLADPQIVRDSVRAIFGRRGAVLSRFVHGVVGEYQEGRLSSRSHLLRWIQHCPELVPLFRNRKLVSLPTKLVEQLESETYRWPVPEIENLDELATFLCLQPRLLGWLTLPHRRRNTNVDHYRRTPRRKRDGTTRWIEEPAPTLKRVQRLIARELLPHIPLHDAARGFRRGYSVKQCAEQHVGKSIVVRIDLKNFFGSIRLPRVRALMETAGYSTDVAHTLACLCTGWGITEETTAKTLQRTRLPQGAPTSPGLANAIAFRLDRRLATLSGLLGVTYTRYADDLVFSGNNAGLSWAKRFATSVAAIAMEEGYEVNFRKTAFLRHGTRQRVLGLIVNEKLNTSRVEYETLKAILHNCKRRGAESQNRDGHPHFRDSIRGRIAHVADVCPSRGEKLLESFDQIEW